MFFYHVKILLTIITLAGAGGALGCPTNEEKQELSNWTCNVNSELATRSQSEPYTMQVDLVLSPTEIRKIRMSLSGVNFETCRKYSRYNLVTAFDRISRHLEFSKEMFQEQSVKATREILSDGSINNIDVCEYQSIATIGQFNYNQSFYHFKYGIGSRNAFLIEVTTKWNL